MEQKIAFVGNCQMLGLKLLYDQFVAGHTGGQAIYVPSYREIDETGSAALVGVTSIVEQVQEFTSTAVLPDAVRSAERCLVPLVSGAFLWPFAGEGHPSNASHPFMDVGPYPAELGDMYLNRSITKGSLAGRSRLLSRLVGDPASPKNLVTSYRSHRFQPDALDRRFEIVMDRQRKRDEICGFSIAEEIDRFFRTEKLFMTPHHPDVRISRALAVQCFGRIGAPQTCIDMLAADLRRSPLPQNELPIHPAVAAHFKLAYINADTKYSFHGEGRFSWTEWFERYIRYSWEPGIFEASAIAESDPGRARDLVRRALERVPQSPLAHFTLARALFRLGDAEGAASKIETSARLEPQDPGIWRLAALIAMHRGRKEEACRFAAQCVTVGPANVLNLDLWARAQEGVEDFAGAEVARRKAVALFPFSAVWHTELGTALMKQPGRLTEALKEYHRGVELNPRHAGAHFGASTVLGKLDRTEEAIEAVRQAIQLNQHVALYHSHLGHLLARMGEREAALAAFRRVLEFEPHNAGVHNLIGNMLLQSEQFEEALEHRRRAAEFEPRNISFQIALCDMLLSRNRITEAIAPLEQAVIIEPGNVDLKLRLARLYAQTGLLDEAAATLRQILELAPGRADACYELSCVLERMGDLAGAEAAIELALAVYPDLVASKEQKIKLREIVQGSRVALVPVRYMASSSEQIIPAITAATPKCLVYTNFLDLNPEFGRYHLRDLYVERERHFPAVSLCRLDPSIRLAVPDGEDVIPIQGNRVVTEQVRPHWGQEQLRAAIAACKREDEIEGPAVLIGRYGVRTWGHWLGELLPKIVAVEAHKPGHFRYVLPQRFDWDPAHRTALQSLRYYGVDVDRLALVSDGTSYRAGELYAVTSVWYPGNMIHPAAAELMRRRAERHGDDTKKADKVALLRRKGRSRNLANQQEVEEFLVERGWLFADLEEMNFQEQVSLFQNAHSIVSILGSGLTGLVYARRGVNVLTLAPSHWGDLFFFARMQERDAKLADIRGTSLTTDPGKVPTASFQVEISEIKAGLLALEEPDQVPMMSRE